MRPMKHIGPHDVTPVHVPQSTGWVVLIEYVTLPTPVDRPIGIIHPVCRGQQMKLRTRRVRGESAASFRGVAFAGRRARYASGEA